MRRRWVVLTFLPWDEPVDDLEEESSGFFPVFDSAELAQVYAGAVEQHTGEAPRVVTTEQYWPAG